MTNETEKKKKLKLTGKLFAKYATFAVVHFVAPWLTEEVLKLGKKVNVEIPEPVVTKIVKTVDSMILVGILQEAKHFHEHSDNRED